MNKDLAQTYASETNDRILETLQFSHPLFNNSYYFVSDVEDWLLGIESGGKQKFTGLPFEVMQPLRDNTADKQMEIILCNIGRELVQDLEDSISKSVDPVLVTYRIYLDRIDSMPVKPVMRMTGHDIAVSNTAVTLKAIKFDAINRPFPDRIYTANEFPGLL